MKDAQNILSEIEVALGGLSFPAHKEEIVEHAEEQGASEEAKAVLEKLPSEEFANLAEVLGKLPIYTTGDADETL